MCQCEQAVLLNPSVMLRKPHSDEEFDRNILQNVSRVRRRKHLCNRRSHPTSKLQALLSETFREAIGSLVGDKHELKLILNVMIVRTIKSLKGHGLMNVSDAY